MEEILTGWLKEYGYIILFLWSIVEGEMGLVMAGLMSHSGNMHYGLSVFVAGLGAFAGDQIYFHIGRSNKRFIHKKLPSQRRKIAISYLLLRKYGWLIIFIQRYMYGFRTIIPLTIGITNYSAEKFAVINLLSAWVWAAVIITPSYVYGEQIWNILGYARQHWYFSLPILGLFFYGVHAYFQKLEQYFLQKRKSRVLT